MNKFYTVLVTNCRIGCYVLSVFLAANAAELQAFQARVIHFAPRASAQQASATVTVAGAVHQAGCYQIDGVREWTLQSIFDYAGGLTSQASPKIKIVRGDRASLVVMYPAQKDFKVLPGDVIVVERGMKSSARVISHQEMSGSQANSGSQSGNHVGRAGHQQTEHRGHVVLLGVSADPVVMPLWMPGLTTETLLTTYLKQEPQVAAGTRILAGRPAGAKAELQDGMILSVPVHLVNQQSLPPLPETVSLRQATHNKTNENSYSPAQAMPPASVQPSPTGRAEELMLIPPVQSQSKTPPESASSNFTTPNSTIPNPVDRKSTSVDPQAKAMIADSSVPGTSQPHEVYKSQIPEPLAVLPEGAFSLTPVLPLELDATANQTAPQEKIIDYSAQLKQGQPKSISQEKSAFQQDVVPQFADNSQAVEPGPYIRSLEQGLRPFDEMLDETLRSAGPLSSADQIVQVPREDSFWKPETQREIQHLALADEVVPAPKEPNAARTPALFGVGAALLIVVGALMVLLNAFRNHFSDEDSEDQPIASHEENEKTRDRVEEAVSEQPVPHQTVMGQLASEQVTSGQAAVAQHASEEPHVVRPKASEAVSAPHIDKRQFSAPTKPVEVYDSRPEKSSASTAYPAAAKLTPPARPAQSPFEQPQPAPREVAVEQVSQPAGKAADPVFAPLELVGLPVHEESLQLPQGLRFFGKPQLHYEFRIDARHEISRPHILSRGAALSPQKTTVAAEKISEKNALQPEPMTESPDVSDSASEAQFSDSAELGAGLFASAYARLREEVAAAKQSRKS